MSEAANPGTTPAPGGAGKVLFSVAALLASVAFLLMGHGLQQTLLPLRGSIEGFSAFSVGLLGSSYFGGYVIGCVLTPRVVMKAGHVRTFAALVAIASSASLAHAIIVDPTVWMAARAVTGFCLAGLYLVIESWLNERATNATRGTIMSAYVTVNLTVITVGQMIVPLFEPQSFVLLSIASILISLAAVPVALTSAEQPAPITLVRFRPAALFRLSPAGVMGVFIVGVANGAFWSLGPVYGQMRGFTVAEVAGFMSLAVIGGAVAQYPLGIVSDKLDRRSVLLGLSGCSIVLGVLLAGLVPLEGNLMLVTAFLLGAAIMPAYAISSAHVFDHGASVSYVEISAGLLLINGLGSVFGPPIASAAMQATGPGALFAFIAASHGVLAGYVIVRRKRRAALDAEQKTGFNIVNAAPVVTIGDADAVEESPLVFEPGQEVDLPEPEETTLGQS